MSDKYAFYNVCLTIKTPSEEGMKFNFKSKLGDITYAVRKFNKQFKDEKEIKLVDVTDINEIILLLKVKVPSDKKIEDISARELSYLSKRLKHDKGWGVYSRGPSGLFTATLFDLLEEKDWNTFEKLPEIPEDYFTLDHGLDVESLGLTDEEALEIFKSLLIVQNIGGDSESTRKRKRNIDQIKGLLVEAFK